MAFTSWRLSAALCLLSGMFAGHTEVPAQTPTVSQPAPVAKTVSAANTAGQALGLLFDSRRAPSAKSMGLLQGNFLDAIKVSGSLQLAVVIDTSESMSMQLDSISENLKFLLADLDRILDGSVETAVITYSDVGEKAVPVTLHSQKFMDAKSTELTIEGLVATTGEPYFHEAVDLGVQRAISNLPWSDEANVARWILLIGDAPPYEASFSESATGAKRWYETQRLVDLANQKNIHVHCLLCESRDSEQVPFKKLLDDTRAFMTKLSSDTGGLMLDTSYAQVRQALGESASRLRSEYVQVGHISQSDIQAARGPVADETAETKTQRIIVAPFLDWDEITFFADRPEVQLATELRTLLKNLPDTRVVQPRQLQEQIQRLKSEGVPESDWYQALCFRLRADCIVTGRLKNTQGQFAVDVEIHDPNSPDVLASTKLTAPADQLARQILAQLAQSHNPVASFAPLVNRLQQFATNQKIDGTEIGALSKLDADQRQRLLSGLTALEQSTGYVLGDPEGVSLLESAEDTLNGFLLKQAQHPYALMLLSNAQFNLASAYEASGWLEEARKKFGQSKQSIQQAFQSRKELVDDLLKLELEGDYHLLVRQEFETSIQRYQTIVAQSSNSPIDAALHAHWMLAGVRSGDWGVDGQGPQFVDLAAARGHLIQILAHWPESPQAELVRKNLMWDPQTQRTRTAFLALTGDALLAQK